MEKSGASQGQSASELISKRIAELGDWRGETLSQMRKLIKEADPDAVEEWAPVSPLGTEPQRDPPRPLGRSAVVPAAGDAADRRAAASGRSRRAALARRAARPLRRTVRRAGAATPGRAPPPLAGLSRAILSCSQGTCRDGRRTCGGPVPPLGSGRSSHSARNVAQPRRVQA